jgi:acyl-coenzyme A thioesterase PaaI-like protein
MPAQVTVEQINELVRESWPSANTQCIEVGERHAVAEMRPTPESLRPGQIISGPTVFGLCDVALWYALFGAVGVELMALTSELSIRYLRPARGEVIWARGDLHLVSRRSVVGSVVVWTTDVDNPVAVAQGTYVRPYVAPTT